MRPSWAFLFLICCATCWSDDNTYEFGGHTKVRLLGQSYPDSTNSLDAAGELRLNFSTRRQQWSFFADYQLLALHSEFLPAVLPNDERRLFDFTKVMNESDDNAIAHRLDRFWIGYTGDKTVVRFGRQALSWGNGLFFSPMDLVNPFDPTTIDTEYKTGDDMLYLQYLRDSGDDWQGAVVFRRDPISRDIHSDQSTVALKYHGFAGEHEYDVLLAESYGETVLGLGGARSIGGAIWRGDVVITDSSTDTVVEIVTNLNYSWVWRDKNVSGGIEYYYDGVENSYVAGSLMIEMSPLWMMTPTLISNVDEQGALLQLVNQYSLSDNMTFLGSLNVPLGANDSFDLAVFAQLAWYF